VVRFICVFFHDAMMKRNNNSLTKDEILAFLKLIAYYISNMFKGLQKDYNKFEQL